MKEKNKSLNIFIVSIYLIFELFILTLSILNDLLKVITVNSYNIKIYGLIGILAFSIISICTYFVETKSIDNKDTYKDQIIIIIAQIFSFCGYIFLLSKENHFILGISSLIITELAYFLRILKYFEISKKKIKYSIFLRIILYVISIILIKIIFNSFDILYIIYLFYFVNLIFNFIDSFIVLLNKNLTNYNKKISIVLYTIGLLLLIISSIFIFIYYFENIYNNFIWIFYLLSSVLISISSFYIISLGVTYNDGK